MSSNSKSSKKTILRARVVIPISRSPIENGALVLSGNRITFVGKWQDVPDSPNAVVVDLGDTAILPGLVNAHCHLDYTSMAGQLPPPAAFTDWLKLITSSKAGWVYSDFAESWLAGAAMLLQTGTTTVGDIEMVPELLPEVWNATPLRIFSFLEMTGVKSRRPPPEILQEALDRIASLPIGRCRAGLSPHAPYSTTPKLLTLSAKAAREHDLRTVVHVSESAQEFDMFMHGKGEMFDWLSRGGRDMSDCGDASPVQHLERNRALSKQLLAVHVNYLADGDAELLARRKVNVVHCPRSHAYFRHGKFPVKELSAAGVNICLGTDSLASVYKVRKKNVELNMFDEMRELAAAHPALPPKTILEMATINGAQALGLKGQVGVLSVGAFADLIAIPFAANVSESYEAAVADPGKLAAGMIDGRWTVVPALSEQLHH
jgi:cytosine/adenosine deaminase-related metal-dependent hydrolase